MTEAITDQQLDEWEKLASEAHRGPWFVRHGTNPGYPHGVECGYPQQVLSEGDVHLIGEFYDGTDVAPAVHAPFVAEARTAVPALIAEVRRLHDLEAWANRMPDAGLTDDDPRRAWWFEKP